MFFVKKIIHILSFINLEMHVMIRAINIRGANYES